jgi:zinc D-Ala-D-Ala dipeptidase
MNIRNTSACFTSAGLTMDAGDGSRTPAPVTAAGRRHRDILASAMTAAGLVNYPAEWWHWSYGDRYWAFQADRGTALYEPF